VIRRTVYFVAGIVVGGYVMYRFGRSARLWSPGGIADRVEKRIGSYREALREFNEDVAEAVMYVLTRPRNHRILEVAFRPMTEPSMG